MPIMLQDDGREMPNRVKVPYTIYTRKDCLLSFIDLSQVFHSVFPKPQFYNLLCLYLWIARLRDTSR